MSLKMTTPPLGNPRVVSYAPRAYKPFYGKGGRENSGTG